MYCFNKYGFRCSLDVLVEMLGMIGSKVLEWGWVGKAGGRLGVWLALGCA